MVAPVTDGVGKRTMLVCTPHAHCLLGGRHYPYYVALGATGMNGGKRRGMPKKQEPECGQESEGDGGSLKSDQPPGNKSSKEAEVTPLFTYEYVFLAVEVICVRCRQFEGCDVAPGPHRAKGASGGARLWGLCSTL